MDERRVVKGKSQNIILENREKISMSGVEHVHSFNEDSIVLETIQGLLTIKGNGLDVSKLNLEDGNVIVQGTIDSMTYTDRDAMSSKGMGFLGKMFK
ncbi:sporulation protein YabP [Lutibacter sp. B2]|nr:sporulation protein YabP [Lutibacter sp. B2]